MILSYDMDGNPIGCKFCGHKLINGWCESCEEYDPPETISEITLSELREKYGLALEPKELPDGSFQVAA